MSCSRSVPPSEPPVDYDVAIVGYGPSGVTAANFLGQYGIKTVVLESETAIYPRARAVTVNDWTLRAYQSVGLDRKLEQNMDAGGVLVWKTYAGKEIMRLESTPGNLGHATSSQIYQPAMEASLRAGVERFPQVVTVHFGARLTDLEQDESGVNLHVENVESGATEVVRARYVLACDGGSSTVRSKLGVELVGKTYDTTWVIIDARVKKWWPGRHLLTFWSDPRRPVVDIPLALGHHRWELPLRPGENRSTLASREALWELLAPFGVTSEHVEILQHAFYVHHVLKAKNWRQGRVFLLGDAAHMMPPWAGQGMQSGIRDAQNIAWKLRAVLDGHLPDSLLDSYEPERGPHVDAMTEVAERLGLLIAATKPWFVFLRNALGPLLSKMPFKHRLFGNKPPTLTSGFIGETPRKGSAVGAMIPQPELDTATGGKILLDDALGDGFAVVGFDVDPRSVLSRAQERAWGELGARYVIVRNAQSSCASSDELIDRYGDLRKWFNSNKTRVVVVRPDRFVVAAETSGLNVPAVPGTATCMRTPLTPTPIPDSPRSATV